MNPSMKRFIAVLLAMLMLACVASATAMTKIDPQADRAITVQPAGLNEMIEGESPTTGLKLDAFDVPEGYTGMALTGRYLPMMVQIGNDDGGIGYRAPWGAHCLDLVYEFPLHKNGSTRLTFVYNDLIPDDVGYIRSARVGNVWLREEWGAGFLFWGQQEAAGSSVPEEFSKLGHNITYDPLLFNGIVGKQHAWQKHYYSREGLKEVMSKGANMAAIYKLVPDDYVAPNHTFKFTDELPAEGDTAEHIRIKWSSGGIKYGSNLMYDAESNTYARFMRYSNNKLHPWVDYDTQEQILFSNVIVQFTDVHYNHSNAAPVVELVGEGNADFFMGGKHIEGVWKRDDMLSRTVYYGPDGEEISLQRGKTLIVLFPDDDEDEREVSYE